MLLILVYPPIHILELYAGCVADSQNNVQRVLVVCMFDSIHSARWLSQFSDNKNVEILLFPSKKFRRLNSELWAILKHNSNIRLPRYERWIPGLLLGYYSYLKYEVLPKKFFGVGNNLRTPALKRLYVAYKPNIIHALEIQGAGYLVSDVLKNSMRPDKAIITNWGSDIYYYSKDESEKLRIAECLNYFTHYSAECQRDYELALRLDYRGLLLPCMPNGGGIDLSQIKSPTSLSSTRNLLLVKAYGGTFGLGQISIEISKNVLRTLEKSKVFFYSVTDDLIAQVKDLKDLFPDRVEYSTVRKGLSHDSLIEKFKAARCYLGMSRSDGISTSFLEALTYGAFPIQTDTSCAAEWIDLGAIGYVANSKDVALIMDKIQAVFLNNDLVDFAQSTNNEIARKYLNFEYLKSKAQIFYEPLG